MQNLKNCTHIIACMNYGKKKLDRLVHSNFSLYENNIIIRADAMRFNSVFRELIKMVLSRNLCYKNLLLESGKSNFFKNTLQGFQVLKSITKLNNLYIHSFF